MTMLEQAQRGVGMAGRASHLFLPGWKASAVSRTVGWFPASAHGTEPHEGVRPPVRGPQPPTGGSWAAGLLLPDRAGSSGQAAAWRPPPPPVFPSLR